MDKTRREGELVAAISQQREQRLVVKIPLPKRSKLLSTSTDFRPITVEQLIAETVTAGFEKLCLGLPITVVIDVPAIINDQIKAPEFIGNGR